MYFRHSDNQNIDFSLVFYVFCAFQDAVWDSCTSKILVFHSKYVYFQHSDNQNIDFSLVFCIFRAFRDAVWDSWLGLAGLPGRAGRAGPSESIRGAKNIEKPCKNGPGLSGTLCFPILFGPHEREMYIFSKEMRPELHRPTSGTTTYISFLRQDPSEETSVWGI